MVRFRQADSVYVEAYSSAWWFDEQLTLGFWEDSTSADGSRDGSRGSLI